ncbi:MAG: hypothetical protein RDV48_14750 [Candidatus Eremiobacteraeota bacterium]|nr:hypothetical protein [Candidatus Eremiobacteraeota bacterium]
MIENRNPMESYTVYKNAVYNKVSAENLPPNYHLKKARNSSERTSFTKAAERATERYFAPADFYRGESNESKKTSEFDGILNLFKELNNKLFNRTSDSQVSYTENRVAVRPELQSAVAPREAQRQSTTNRASELPAHLQNTWWNVINAEKKAEKMNPTSIAKNLQDWVQTEYDQSDDYEGIYSRQELRDRLEVLDDINQEVLKAGQKSAPKKSRTEWDENAGGWDLAKPLPLSPKAVGTYEAMDDEEDYRNVYNFATFELVA